jgi:hypothetical protein
MGRRGLRPVRAGDPCLGGIYAGVTELPLRLTIFNGFLSARGWVVKAGETMTHRFTR